MYANQTLEPLAGDTNRRRSRRRRLGTPARLWLDVGWQQVICEDVSKDGAGLIVYRPDLHDLLVFPTRSNDTVRMTLELPNGRVDVAGRLVPRGPNRVGLRFTKVTSEARAKLNAALA